jgi:hypothetical protein
MLLPIIEITQLNTKLTNREKAALAKFQSLSRSAIASLHKALSYSEELANHVGTTGKSIASYRQEMMESADRLDTAQFHHLTNTYRNDISKSKMLPWYKEQHKTLNEAATWSRLNDACRNKDQKRKLHLLKSEWDEQQKYAIYTSASLLELTERVIPLFENYLEMLAIECRYYKNKLSAKTKAHLQGCINNLKAEISKEKEHIVHSMLSRLKAASSSNTITFDDVTLYFTLKLEQLGALRKDYRLPTQPRRDLDNNRLQYFQNYIAKWGKPSQVERLTFLKWNKPDNVHTVMRHGNEFLHVPKRMSNSIKNDGLIDIIFNREKEREKFLADRFGLLTHLRYLPDPKENYALLTFCENDKWQHLCHLSEMLSAESKSARGNLQSLSFAEQLLNTTQFKFVDGWNHYLQRQQKTLVNAMLSYARFISEQLRTRITLGLDLDQILSEQFQSQLKNFDLTLSLAITRAGLLKTQCPAYLLFSEQVNQLKNLPNLALARRIEKLEEGTALNNIEAPFEGKGKQGNEVQNEKTLKSYKALEELDNDNPFRAISKESELKALLIHLLSNCPLDLSNTDIISTLDKIKMLLEVVKIEHSDFAETSKKLLVAYLAFWVSSEENGKENKIKISMPLEFILRQIIAPSFQFTFNELISIRDGYDWFVFKTKCYAVLSSLEPEQEENYLNALISPLSDKKVIPSTDEKTIPSTTSNHATFFHHNNSKSEIHLPSLHVNNNKENSHANY